jgi:hypothetical protein
LNQIKLEQQRDEIIKRKEQDESLVSVLQKTSQRMSLLKNDLYASESGHQHVANRQSSVPSLGEVLSVKESSLLQYFEAGRYRRQVFSILFFAAAPFIVNTFCLLSVREFSSIR